MNENRFDKENCLIFDEILNKTPINLAEKFVFDKVNEQKGSVIDFPCINGRAYEFIQDKENYQGFDFRRRFVEIANDKIGEPVKFSLLELYKMKDPSNAEHLVSLGHLNKENEPIVWVKDVLEHLVTDNVYFTCNYSKDIAGSDLDALGKRMVLNNHYFFYTVFSVKAVQEIADSAGLSVTMFDDNSAVLYKNKAKEIIVPEKVSEEQEEPPKEEEKEEIKEYVPEKVINRKNKKK